MELENLGFIAAIRDNPNLETSVLNFYCNPAYFQRHGFSRLRLSFLRKVNLFFSIRFLKIFFKSGCRMDQSLANLALNFPEVIEGFLENAVDSCDLCFTSIRPGKLLHLIHGMAVKSQKRFAYHEISKFNPKHFSFFQQVNTYGTFMISGFEKREDLQRLFPNASKIDFKQWLYDGQDDFLKIPEPDSKRLTFGTVSRLDYGKNFEVVFEAISILKKQGIKLKFLLFGDGTQMQQLKELAAKLQIEAYLEFRGAVKFEERRSVYAELDVFLMSSMVEGGPVTILEAMAAGRPAISSNVGDVRCRIKNGFNGYILDSPTDVIELSEKIKNYIDHPNLVSQHGRNSRLKFRGEFDEKVGKEIFVESICHLVSN